MSISDDITAILERDPAARTRLEVALTYPGLHAICIHRLASALHGREHFLGARIISNLGRFITGVEIHPGAVIGERVFIDHGMGVVIGETAEVGDDCTLYQGVTLGGTGQAGGKRHPTLLNGVIAGVGAKILGDVTIGSGAKIGGGAVVLTDVPAHTTAVGAPARAVAWTDPISGVTRRLETLPDPRGDAMTALTQRIEALEEELRQLRYPASGGDTFVIANVQEVLHE